MDIVAADRLVVVAHDHRGRSVCHTKDDLIGVGKRTNVGYQAERSLRKLGRSPVIGAHRNRIEINRIACATDRESNLTRLFLGQDNRQIAIGGISDRQHRIDGCVVAYLHSDSTLSVRSGGIVDGKATDTRERLDRGCPGAGALCRNLHTYLIGVAVVVALLVGEPTIGAVIAHR